MRHFTISAGVLALLGACAEVPPQPGFDGNLIGGPRGATTVVITPPPPPSPVSTAPLPPSTPTTASSRVIRSTDMAPPPLETNVLGAPPPPAPVLPDTADSDA